MDPEIKVCLSEVNSLTDGRLAADYPPPDYILVGNGLIVPRQCTEEEWLEKYGGELSDRSSGD